MIHKSRSLRSLSSKKGKSKKRKNSQTPNSDEQTKRQVPNMASPIVYGGASDNNNQHSLSPKEDTPQSYMVWFGLIHYSAFSAAKAM